MKSFKEIISEKDPLLQKSKWIEDLYEWVEEQGGKVSIQEKDNSVTLSKIQFPKELRGKGLGTKFMEKLTEGADEAGKTILLDPDTSFGASSKNRLKKFYKKFGFVENKGKHKDFTISKDMYREPK